MRLARITCERISRGIMTRDCSRLAAASFLFKFEASYDSFSFFVFFIYIIAILMNFVEPSYQKRLTLFVKILIF